MPHHFSIWIVTPPGYAHSRAFEPYALTLQAAFAELGFDAPVVTDSGQIKDRAIVLAANLLPMLAGPLPEKLILYNMEQIQKDSPWLRKDYVNLLKKYPVWDYSERNIARLASEFGVRGAVLCGVGYMPVISTVPAAPKDTDVVFIGSMSDRRMHVLQALAAAGKKVSAAYNVYGAEADALIARARINLNLHYYEAQVFEIVRVSYLLANKACIVSETGLDETLEKPVQGGVAFAPYEKLVETCLHLLEQEDEREALAQKGFEIFSALSQVPMLSRALETIKL